MLLTMTSPCIPPPSGHISSIAIFFVCLEIASNVVSSLYSFVIKQKKALIFKPLIFNPSKEELITLLAQET